MKNNKNNIDRKEFRRQMRERGLVGFEEPIVISRKEIEQMSRDEINRRWDELKNAIITD